jgi:hypothetical protein
MSGKWAIFIGIISPMAILALIYLFMENNSRHSEIGALQARLDATSNEIATKIDALQKATDDLKAGASQLSDRVNAQGRDVADLKRTSADLKNDLSNATASKISKEIVASATDQAVAKSVVEFAASRGPKFLEDLGNELVQHHRTELTGPPGRNVDDERVAHFLLAQPDFLTAVSITLIQHQEKQQ